MNNIVGHYLMPHPPIIIPDIGKGEEGKIADTANSCNAIGKEISDLKPDTIILIMAQCSVMLLLFHMKIL